MTRGWMNWYHCTLTCYGQWLRGDPRGWRERNHRLHVEGDYKSPPEPTAYNKAIFRQSQKILKFDPVEFTMEERGHVCVYVLRSLEIQQIDVRAIAVGAKHTHVLINCPRDNPKAVIGKAKTNVWMQLVNGGEKLKTSTDARPLWAVGSHAEPITEKDHFINAFWYILEHRLEGAWTWCFKCERDGRALCKHLRA